MTVFIKIKALKRLSNPAHRDEQSRRYLSFFSGLTPQKSLLTICILSMVLIGVGGCDNSSVPEWAQSYFNEIRSFNHHQKTSHSKRVTIRIRDQESEFHADLSIKLPSSKKRRYTIPSGPLLNVRSFIDIGACEVARHVAYRNSPLGRSMLPSQHLIYDARFIYDAPKCKVKESGKKAVAIAVESKLKSWDQRWWNAIWGGRELGSYLSRSWPRGRALRGVDVSDESTFAWLAQLNPQDAPIIVEQLEMRLGQLPKHVGGKIIDEAADVLYVLRESERMLSQLDQDLKSSATIEGSKRYVLSQKQCDILKRAKKKYIEFQPTVSARYQALLSLSEAFKPITQRIKAPTQEVEHYIVWWLNGAQAAKSALQELRQLSRKHAQMWGDLGILKGCQAHALPEQ